MDYQPVKGMNCEKGWLVPLFDFSKEGGFAFLKAWACTHCQENVMMHLGSLSRQVIQEPKR